MSEKKMVRRSVAIALGIVCIILVAGLGVMIYVSYSPTSGSSNASYEVKIDQLQGWLDGNKSQILDLQNQNNQFLAWLDGNETLLNQTQAWLGGNITAYDNYVSDHHYTDSEYNSLMAPKLVTVHLLSDDGGLPFQSRRLHIIGSIVNVGMNPASNSTLHVTAYISQVLAINTDIQVGTINGESWTYIDQTITYSGGTALSSWTITPQWTSS